MKTLQQFEKKIESIPTITSWYLADLGEARGKQELFTKQSPQKLKVLKEHALIESAISSNRIEGVTVDQARAATVVLGNTHLKDRDEEEVRSYRKALDWIHRDGRKIAISDLEKACPGVSRDMIRIVMNRLRKQKRLKILGRGRDAKWTKT